MEVKSKLSEPTYQILTRFDKYTEIPLSNNFQLSDIIYLDSLLKIFISPDLT